MISRLRTLGGACHSVGVTNTLLYVWKTKAVNKICSTKPKLGGYRTGTLSSKQLQHPVVFRYNSSDISVFSQIFIAKEYQLIDPIGDVKFIIDCGANVGYSSAYWLSRFPEARVVAIEPDKRNYELLKQNLSAYGNRVTTLCSAIWSHKVGLKVCSGRCGDRSEHATTVRECADGEEADLEAVDMPTLLGQSGHNEIDVLKMDIEGTEKIIFSRNCQSWINRTRLFIIELHGQECREIFYRALSSDSFSFSYSGELTIARRRPIHLTKVGNPYS